MQSRPITTSFVKDNSKELKGEILLSGLGASPGVSFGVVKVINNLDELSKIKKGDVLVTEMTNPDMVVAMQKAAGIITDEGGITSHASIVSREMGIPCVVGTGEATKKLYDGMIVTVDGNNGRVYEGRGETKTVEIKPIINTKTKIKVIVDLPDYAKRAALSGAKEVGLVRLEGIIATCGKHPLFFIKNKKSDEYVKILHSGLRKIAEPFDEIWVRSSDIRSDEFKHLEGAVQEAEGNPMLGDHGIRFTLKHIEILRAEILAIKLLAQDFPNKKIGFMIPQVISVEEVKRTKEEAERIGILKNVKIGIMVETPAAVQIINDLCEEGIDFVSFGTNDLTQYTLAIDRNNSGVQDLYNEMNPSVLSSIRYVIRRCKKYGVETSVCGQAASREDMAKFLVEEGIDSLSVNADAAHNVSVVVSKVERELGEKRETERRKIEKKINYEDNQLRDNSQIKRKERKEENIEAEMISERKIALTPMMMAVTKEENEDIEEIVLKELDDWDKNEEEIGKEEDYVPANEDKSDKDIPPLNDAIPVDSEHFEEVDELGPEKEI